VGGKQISCLSCMKKEDPSRLRGRAGRFSHGVEQNQISTWMNRGRRIPTPKKDWEKNLAQRNGPVKNVKETRKIRRPDEQEKKGTALRGLGGDLQTVRGLEEITIQLRISMKDRRQKGRKKKSSLDCTHSGRWRII